MKEVIRNLVYRLMCWALGVTSIYSRKEPDRWVGNTLVIGVSVLGVDNKDEYIN